VQTGDQVAINGFIISGKTPKKILARAIGPSLQVKGQPVPGRLMNPTLELRNKSGGLIFSNDDWTMSPQKAQIQGSGLAPKDSREAAILITLKPGEYTTIVRGKNNTTGIALGEIYGLPPATDSELANLSARALVLTGDNVLIDGLIVGGNTRKDILIRAIGPELTARGVTGVLQDPVLDLYNRDGTLVRRNDNWRDAPNRAKIQASGLAPTDNRESAILMEMLAPGEYTAIVRGVNGTTGIALAEVYTLK
jgi:hypothetical protein